MAMDVDTVLMIVKMYPSHGELNYYRVEKIRVLMILSESNVSSCHAKTKIA